MTTPPPERTPLVAPTTEETRALAEAHADDEIRALAQQLQAAMDPGRNLGSWIKAVVTAVDFNGSPPTLSIQIGGDTTTTVTNVRLLNNYTPEVGHTVLVAYQGADIVVFGHIADAGALFPADNGWIKATLSSGTSHNGNSNGDVYYRRVLEDGSWKMQWQGAVSVGSNMFIIDTGQALGSEYRPTSLRSMMAARNSTGSNDVKLDFRTDGRVQIVGANTTGASSTVSGDVWSNGSHSHSVGSHSHGGGTGSIGGHQHFTSGVGSTFAGGHSHGIGSTSLGTGSSGYHDHGFSSGSHTHSVTTPTWVSLNGIEYFI